MGEKLNKVIVPLAAGIAATSIGLGRAEAATHHLGKAGAEIAQTDGRVPIEQAKQTAEAKLLAGEDVNWYRGSVNIEYTDGSRQGIANPVLIYLYGAKNHKEEQFALNHPNSKFWAVAYFGDQDGHLTVVPQDGSVKVKFFANTTEEDRHDPNAPLIDAVRFSKDASGNIDLMHPLDHFNNPILDRDVGDPSMAPIGAPFQPIG